MSRKPYLTKSTFVSAIKCEKWLWKNFHNQPETNPPPVGSPANMGSRIGKLAHQLFPSGIEITEAPWEHVHAVKRTQELMSDESVPAIFEATFEYEGVRVRIDILERLSDHTWRICEVKSAASIREKNGNLKEHYARDVQVQEYVVRGQTGSEVSSIQLVFINRDYNGSAGTINVSDYFEREEVKREPMDTRPSSKKEIDKYLAILNQADEPESEPSKSKCTKLGSSMCPFWGHCTVDKPNDWVEVLFSPRKGQLQELKDTGKDSILKLDIEDAGSTIQGNIIRAVKEDKDIVSDTLTEDLSEISLPAIHLDFEYLAGVALPVYDGMRPFEVIPFQYSAHRLFEDGSFEHVQEFLAKGDLDPRREFIDHLIGFLSKSNEPIIVWSAERAEISVLKGLRQLFPDLETEIDAIIVRIKDLAITVRDNVILNKMVHKKSLSGGGFFSLKNVAPACNEDFSYDTLQGVAHGGQAVEAYVQLVTGELPEGVTEDEMRNSLLAYCEYDTLATTLVHKKLIEMGSPSGF